MSAAVLDQRRAPRRPHSERHHPINRGRWTTRTALQDGRSVRGQRFARRMHGDRASDREEHGVAGHLQAELDRFLQARWRPAR